MRPSLSFAAVILVVLIARGAPAQEGPRTIAFPDSSRITLAKNATVRIVATTVQVLSGALRFDLTHVAGGTSEYHFSTPVMDVVVRGTLGLLSDGPSGDALTCLACGAGDVVATVAGRSFAVVTGETLRASAAGKVSIEPTTPGMLEAFRVTGISTEGGLSPGVSNAARGSAIVLPAAAALAIGAAAAGGHGGSSAPGGGATRPTPGASPTASATPSAAPITSGTRTTRSR